MNEMEIKTNNPEGSVVEVKQYELYPDYPKQVVSLMDTNPKMKPLKIYASVSIPATSNYDDNLVATLASKGDEVWYLSAIAATSSTSCEILAMKADGSEIGIYVGTGGNYKEEFLKTQRYGDFIKVTEQLDVVVTNNGATAENITVEAFGFKIPLA